MDKSSFSTWILGKINEQGISQAEFARRCGFSTATLSRILDGSRGLGLDVCCKIADQLSLPQAYVLNKAGLITGSVEEDENRAIWLGLFERLSKKDRAELIMIAKYRISMKR